MIQMFRHTQDKLKKNDGVAGERPHAASPYSAENVHSKSPIRGRVKACAMCVCVCVCVCVYRCIRGMWAHPTGIGVQ